jgi:hypothetical protein
MEMRTEYGVTTGEVAFALFGLIVVMVGIVFIAALSNQQSAITDTYGNTLNPTSNTSQNLVTSIAATEESSAVPLILIGCVVFLCMVLFIAWAASKSGISV